MKINIKKAEIKKEEVLITTDFIRLDAFLKFKGIALTGGEAKIFIQEGKIKVNNETCTARGKKLRAGDVVRAFGIEYMIKNQ